MIVIIVNVSGKKYSKKCMALVTIITNIVLNI